MKTDYNFGLPASVWDESSRKAHWRNAPEGQPFFSVINLTTTHESQVWQSELPLSVDPDSVPVPPYLPDTPLVRRDIAQLYTNIEQMDRQVGQILADLEEDGLADNTVVFFWSDHGGPLPRQKSWVYDSGIHVPLIIRWPGHIAPGQVNGELVSFVDLAPTVLIDCRGGYPGCTCRAGPCWVPKKATRPPTSMRPPTAMTRSTI
ncbi:MAG: sulfatase-like hydrolase/transferase [Balneolaceae bacterium]|nr:sulfatase-like hydrolase/transferase [Balneolaceae bacterium]